MDINAVKNPVDFSGPVQATQANHRAQAIDSELADKLSKVEEKLVTAQSDDKDQKKPVDFQDLTQMTEAMNKFVKAMEANIQFIIHEGTNQLMVQVVDQSNNKVLKEFPSSEFLDTMAAIRDYVGILLDKKI